MNETADKGRMKGMQVGYRKSMDHYYLVVTHEGGLKEDYQLRMVLENRIPGLLPMEIRQRDGRKDLYYDVSSMQPLARIYDRRELSGREMQKVFGGILDALASMQEYMLEESGAVLDPAFIFMDMESREIRLLFLPVETEAEAEDPLLQPAEFLMEHADHRDAEAALCAYRLYQTIRKGSYVAADLRRAFEKRDKETGDLTERIPVLPEAEVTERQQEWDRERDRDKERDRDRDRDRDKVSSIYRKEIPAEEMLPEKPAAGEDRNERDAGRPKLPLVLSVLMMLSGGLACSGILPGVGADKAGRLAAAALITAGAAVFLVQWIRGRRSGRDRQTVKQIRDAEKTAPESFDALFADLPRQERPEHDLPVRQDIREEPEELFRSAPLRVHDPVLPADAEENYGRTVFAGEIDAPVEHILVEKGRKKEYPMDHFPFTVGKMKECVDLALNDRTVSRIHARIFLQNGKAYLQDCHSTNGTRLNGVQLEAEEKVMLEKDDEIEFGKVKFCYI